MSDERDDFESACKVVRYAASLVKTHDFLDLRDMLLVAHQLVCAEINGHDDLRHELGLEEWYEEDADEEEGHSEQELQEERALMDALEALDRHVG